MAITRIKAETALSGTIPSTNISQSSMANVSTGTSWQAVKTTSFTAESGKGYFVDTTSGAITVTLPSSPSAGDYVVLKDYARNWGTNAVTMASALFDGVASQTPSFSTNGQTVTIVYMDETKGWSLINEDTTSTLGALFVTATGGTVTTSGDFKIHTFTGDGCFVVSCGGNSSGSNTVDYLVVAGGAGAGSTNGANAPGGGGAGGFRESHSVPVSGCYTASPLATPTGITVSATTYPITVGAGGATGPCGPGGPGTGTGNAGNNSIFSTITSTGGGAPQGSYLGGNPGGSGAGGSGGTSALAPGGTGNSPPVSPPQGNPGGTGSNTAPDHQSGGGGGAGGAGTPSSPNTAGTGGVGVSTSISGSSLSYAGGGGGSGYGGAAIPLGLQGNGSSCGTGGQGTTYSPNTAGSGTTNRGGGGGSASGYGPPGPGPSTGGAGGSGVVIIRYRYQ